MEGGMETGMMMDRWKEQGREGWMIGGMDGWRSMDER